MNMISSRDIGNKFMFGHFMMGSKFAVPPTKHKLDPSKAWVFLKKEDEANDYDLGGEVFAYPGKGNVEDRTWRVLDGSDSSAKISKSQLMRWIAKEMMKGANGIAIWMEDWTNNIEFLEKAKNICNKFKVTLVGICESYMLPSAPVGSSGFEDACKKLNDIFDEVLIRRWNDNWISFADTMRDWQAAGYTKPIHSLQDGYSRESGGSGKHGAWVELENGYAVWKNIAAWSLDKGKGFCLYDPQKLYENDTKKIRLTLLKRIFEGTKTIPNWGNIHYGPDDPENPMGTGEGADLDPDENQKS